jgi:hypothetical protein
MADADSVADHDAAPTASLPAPLHFARIVVIGGGCYGSWYVQQLSRAFAKGALTCASVIVVDRNAHPPARARALAGDFGALPLAFVQSTWTDFLASWLAEGAERLAYDALVPSPLMPHLLLEWLVDRAVERWPQRRVGVKPLDRTPNVPWQRAAPDGRHYVSFAEWMCPVNCIEPQRCPATRGPRDWSMPVTLSRFVGEPQVDGSMPLRGPVTFPCVHRTWGVGMIDVAPVVAADAEIARWGSEGPINVLVGTTSHCHGALGVLAVG